VANQSAGILLFRKKDQLIELFLVHPGGPYWKKKDLGAWTIPKGEFTNQEEPLAAAKREFQEETGVSLSGGFIPLKPTKQKAGKVIYAWAVEGDIDPLSIRSNFFSMEWPPKSGKRQEFPEVDKAGWFQANEAKQKINPAQVSFIEELENMFT
jgi:predicted NUDIX family NTP pyrophosphohydrolase